MPITPNINNVTWPHVPGGLGCRLSAVSFGSQRVVFFWETDDRGGSHIRNYRFGSGGGVREGVVEVGLASIHVVSRERS